MNIHNQKFKHICLYIKVIVISVCLHPMSAVWVVIVQYLTVAWLCNLYVDILSSDS